MGNAQDRNHADGSWESDILAHLQRFKRYPTGARLDRLEDRIQVEIQVDRNGQVIQHRILRSAGIPILDQAVNELLHRAAPLPAPPSAVPEQRLRFNVIIDYTMRSRRSSSVTRSAS